eukprot:6491367-Amphidinium_carterae.1
MTSQWPANVRPTGSSVTSSAGGEQSLSGALHVAGVPTPGSIGRSIPEERDREAGSGGVRPWDTPPRWDGANPETQLEPYLRALKAWMLTTRVPRIQQGVVLMASISGDLRVIAGELEVSEITSEQGSELLYNLIEKTYAWTTIRNLPAKYELALFASSGQRSKGETFLAYSARKTALLKDLKRAGVDLPSPARGLTLLRDAKLSRAEQESVLFWTKGDFEEALIIDALRRLERPGGLPGNGGGHQSGGQAVFWHDEEEEMAEYDTIDEEGILEGDEEWPLGVEDDGIISEDHAHVILAQGYGQAPASTATASSSVMPPRPSYNAARQQMQYQRTQRGYLPPQGANSSSYGGGKKEKGRKRDHQKGSVETSQVSLHVPVAHDVE